MYASRVCCLPELPIIPGRLDQRGSPARRAEDSGELMWKGSRAFNGRPPATGTGFGWAPSIFRPLRLRRETKGAKGEEGVAQGSDGN